MFICEHCGQVFDQPGTEKVTESYGGDNCGNSVCTPQVEEIDICPHCKSQYIKELKCDVCGKLVYYLDHVKAENGDRVCFGCLTDYFVNNYGGEYE